MKNNYKGFLALLSAAVIYSLYGLFIRTLDIMYGNYSQITARFLVAFILISIILYFTKNREILTFQQKKLSIYGGILGGFSTIFFVLAIIDVKISDTVFSYYIGSMITSFLMGTFIYKESVKFKKILMTIIALTGFLFYINFNLSINLGIIMALLSGILEGFNNILRKKLRDANRNEVTKIKFFIMTIILIMVMFMFPAEPLIKEISIIPIILTFVYGAALITISYLLLYGFANYDVNVGTIILSSEVFFSAIVGYIFFAEVLSAHEWIGGILIFIATTIGGVNFNFLKKYYTKSTSKT